jgi:GWxTD domain-containing protein
MRTIYSAIMIIIATVSISNAQDSPGITDVLVQQPFWVDYTAFHGSRADSLEVEVYYKIYSSLLPFHKWGERFKAEYVVDIIINKKGKQVTGASNDGEMIADSYKATISKDDFLINRMSFALIPDDYQLIARLSDPSSGELIAPVKVDLKLKDFGKKTPEISGLEFIREATPVTDDSQFVRSNLRLIPSVSRIYGEDSPEVILYYEVYNQPDFHDEYLAICDIKDRERILYSDTTMFPSDGSVTPHLERIKVNELRPEEYGIELNITSPGNEIKITRYGIFKIGWSATGLVKNDFKTAVEQLRYIASADQMKQLHDASAEERLKLWTDFWKTQDPTPATPENEKKEEYYKRLRYADLNFGHFGRDGWKADMGMVYITYGPPDEIERHPFDIDAKPYQFWYYYELRRVFRFVDVNGYGEYELIYPYDGDTRKFR